MTNPTATDIPAVPFASGMDAEPADFTGYGLFDYDTDERIRRATVAELDASFAQAKHDNGAGVIDVNGRTCYVA